MTCKNCVHCEICYVIYAAGKFQSGAELCKNFKNKAGCAEVKHGYWRKVYDKAPRYVCSACNHLFNNKEYKYCPHCGAKMDGRK